MVTVLRAVYDSPLVLVHSFMNSVWWMIGGDLTAPVSQTLDPKLRKLEAFKFLARFGFCL